MMEFGREYDWSSFISIMSQIEQKKKHVIQGGVESMFEVTFEDKMFRQWSCEFQFSSFDDAKNYLLSEGFIERNRLFYKENYGWTLYLKAYITPKRIYLCVGG